MKIIKNKSKRKTRKLYDRLRRNVYRGRDDFSRAQKQKTRSIERMTNTCNH